MDLSQFVRAFLCGGLICAFSQVLIDRTRLTPARILTSYVVLGVVLTAIGIYQPIVDWGGCGATTPLFGFGYAMAKWASGIIFDIWHCAGNFVMALLLFMPMRKLFGKLYGKLRA